MFDGQPNSVSSYKNSDTEHYDNLTLQLSEAELILNLLMEHFDNCRDEAAKRKNEYPHCVYENVFKEAHAVLCMIHTYLDKTGEHARKLYETHNLEHIQTVADSEKRVAN